VKHPLFQQDFLCAGFRWADYFCFEIGSRWLADILFGVIWCFSGVPRVRVPFWFGPKVWWADHFWFEIGSQFVWIKFGFGLFMVSFGGSEVERWWKLNDLSDRSFSAVAQFWCLGLGVILRGVFSFGVSSDDGWYWISFLQWLFFAKKSVLGGDVS